MDYSLIFILYLLGVSLVTYLMYGLDKKKARNGECRISEETLHLLAFIGGTPAAYIAQRRFRHKTKKTSFQIVFWVISAIQIAVIYFVLMAFKR